MRKYISFLFLLAVSFVQVACSDDDSGSGVILEVNIPSIVFNNMEPVKVEIICNGPWIAQVPPKAWCTLDKKEGEGNGEVWITPKERTDFSELKTVFTVVSVEDFFISRDVALSMKEERIKLSSENIVFDNDNETIEKEISFNYDGPWTAELTDDSWCSIDKTSGTGSAKIKIKVTDLETSRPQSSELVITSVLFPNLQATLNIEKEGGEYSHGECIVLQKATVGKGIDIVIVGDGFTKEDLKYDGKWEQAFQKIYGKLFILQPFATYRDWFNVYAVTTLSESNDCTCKSQAESNTFFETYIPPMADPKAEGFKVGLQKEMFKFVYDHSPVKDERPTVKEVLVAVALNNADAKCGYCYTSHHMSNEYGMAYAAISVFREADISNTINHELLGHGFGVMGDEYYSPGTTLDASRIPDLRDQKKKWGTNMNLEYTPDPTKFDNPNFTKMWSAGYTVFPDFRIMQGGLYCEKGIYRLSSKNTIMNTDFFYVSAAQMEIFLSRIYKLGGKESEYSFEVFKEFYVNNINK